MMQRHVMKEINGLSQIITFNHEQEEADFWNKNSLGDNLLNLMTSFNLEENIMPVKDIYHDTVKKALIKNGWTITDDPLTLKIGRRSAMIDLGAEKLIGAQLNQYKIAVEIKSFLNPSPLNDLENALGQFILYSKVLDLKEPDRILFLAINKPVFEDIFSEEIGKLLLETTELKLLVFDAKKEDICQWIPENFMLKLS